MEPLHARYPFFETAREAVSEAEVSLPRLIADDAPAVERGRERVERALLEATTAPEDPGRWTVQDELLSYPVARILVSLLDEGKAVSKYAEAEAATAAARFEEDFEGGDDELRSTTDASVTLDRVLREFDLDGAVRAEATGRRAARGPEWFRVAVGRYLALSDADWGEEWRLATRELADGEVRVRREELTNLLEEAVRRRVAEGLPFELDADADEQFRASLSEELSELRSLLGEREEIGRIDVVLPERFPPCIDSLLDVATERELEPVESFSLLSFLAAIGMDADEVTAFCSERETTLSAAQIQYQVARVGDERGAQYPPPSCETLAGYGICENEGDHRERAGHPLALYQLRVADTPPEERTDWRERKARENGPTPGEA